eukprot:g3289.t1
MLIIYEYIREKRLEISTLVAVALCSFMLVHTALGESNLMKVLKRPGKGPGKGAGGHGGYGCFRQGRKGRYGWPVAYYQAKNGISWGDYINVDNLRIRKGKTIYPFNCDRADKGTGLCKDIKNQDLGEHYCSKCSFTGTQLVNTMQGGKISEKQKSGKLNIKLYLSCRQTYGNIGKRARYTYRVEDSGSRRRRLLGMKRRDADCRL